MMATSVMPEIPRYVVPEAALRVWSAQRLRCCPRADGGIVYWFLMSGSTCTGIPLEVLMTVAVGADGRIESATARPAAAHDGCDAMCAAQGDGQRFMGSVGQCDEAIGLTLGEAARYDWREEPSGCFCSAGNRRHKWRNVFQTLHYAATHANVP